MGLSPNLIYDRVKRGTIPFKRIDGSIRFLPEELKAWKMRIDVMPVPSPGRDVEITDYH